MASAARKACATEVCTAMSHQTHNNVRNQKISVRTTQKCRTSFRPNHARPNKSRDHADGPLVSPVLQMKGKTVSLVEKRCRSHHRKTPHETMAPAVAVSHVSLPGPTGRQSDQPTWVPKLLSTCEGKLKGVNGQEDEQHPNGDGPLQTRNTPR